MRAQAGKATWPQEGNEGTGRQWQSSWLHGSHHGASAVQLSYIYNARGIFNHFCFSHGQVRSRLLGRPQQRHFCLIWLCRRRLVPTLQWLHTRLAMSTNSRHPGHSLPPLRARDPKPNPLCPKCQNALGSHEPVLLWLPKVGRNLVTQRVSI